MRNPDAVKKYWISEYSQVLAEYQTVQKCPCSFYKEIDLAVLTLTSPVHYYALFSKSRGYDIVVAKYSDQRYEVEIKYSTMVDLISRPCFPRLEMGFLAKHLNYLEEKMDSNFSQGYIWKADRITDSGPILRIESLDGNITKAERYAHPSERAIYPSSINSDDFETLAVSYFAHGLGSSIRRKDYEWSELHEFNGCLDWTGWTSHLPKHLQ